MRVSRMGRSIERASLKKAYEVTILTLLLSIYRAILMSVFDICDLFRKMRRIFVDFIGSVGRWFCYS